MKNKLSKMMAVVLTTAILVSCSAPPPLDKAGEESLYAKVYGTKATQIVSDQPQASNSSENEVKEEIHQNETSTQIEENTQAKDTTAQAAGQQDATESCGQLETHIVDCGQADTTIIKYGNKGLVIDAGAKDSTTLINYVKALDIDTFSIIITHYDLDHIESVDEILANFSIDLIYLPSYEVQSENYSAYDYLHSNIKKQKIKTLTPQIGSKYTFAKDITLQFVGPIRTYEEENANSLCCIVRYKEDSFFYGGDTTAEAEQDMVNCGYDLDIDIYHVSHHGSQSSSSDALIEKLSPIASVLSVGRENEYNLPNTRILNKLLKYDLYRTDEQGTIVVTSEGKGTYTFNTAPWQPSEADKYILNTSSKKIHLPGCKNAENISENNRAEVQQPIKELVDEGYSTCGECIR